MATLKLNLIDLNNPAEVAGINPGLTNAKNDPPFWSSQISRKGKFEKSYSSLQKKHISVRGGGQGIFSPPPFLLLYKKHAENIFFFFVKSEE